MSAFGMRRGTPPRLDGRVIVVTGASAGIGEATALAVAAVGGRVVATARRADRLQRLRSRVEGTGGPGTLLAMPGDVTLEEDRRRLVDETIATFGRIDGLVNNAGYGQSGPIELVPASEVRRNFETNVFSLIALTQLVIPSMRHQGSGRIVNVSSVAGRVVGPFSAVYGATKHALEAISDGLRAELAPFGIAVVVIQPGFVQTEFSDVADEISRSLQDPDDLYRTRMLRKRERYLRMKRMAAPPSRIASLILEALTADRPRARYAAPLHARVALLAKRVLPEGVLEAILERR
jgi:NAD(P)-dependent dehydrogenase (short-subunit alcohol dehydrogenase family)